MKPLKFMFGMVMLCTCSFAAQSPVYQAVDPNYRLFKMQVVLRAHTDESSILLYEAPHGSMYDGGWWGHEELFQIDLRRIVVDWGWLKNVPLFGGLYFKTWPFTPYADSYQLNAAFAGIILPKIHGFTFSLEGHSVSNSGHQAGDAYAKLYYQDNLGLIDKPDINLVSMMVTYYETTGSGIHTVTDPAVTPGETIKGRKDQPVLTGTGVLWQAKKAVFVDVTVDGQPLGLQAYLAYRYERYWTDDPTQLASVYGSSFERHGVYYGNTYMIGRDLVLQGEVGGERLSTKTTSQYVLRGRALMTLQTNFE
jgi:hypothetical protein